MTEHERTPDRDSSADPRTADEQDSPEPERPPTIQEKHGQHPRLDDPAKAEGNRDEVDDEQGGD